MSNAGRAPIADAPLIVSAGEMEAFDQLDQALRDLLRDAPTNYSAVQALDLSRLYGASRTLEACRRCIERAFSGYAPAVARRVRRTCR